MEHPQEGWGGTKVYINGLDHMTKMADMPIYGKNHEKTYSETGGNLVCIIGDSDPS